jgi:hypothetical protein
MTPGTGKVVFIGSHEMWRLRMYREKYHERFWIKLARYAGSGNLGRLQSYGDANIPDRMKVGKGQKVEYRLRGPDRRPLEKKNASLLRAFLKPFKDPSDTKPDPDPKTWLKLTIEPKPSKRDEETGWFTTQDFEVRSPGKYQFELIIPNPRDPSRTLETLRNTVLVDRPNPELDNLRPNLQLLYRIASDNELVMPRVKEEVQKKLKELKGPQEEGEKSTSKDGKRLYFDLESAPLIPELMITASKRERTKGNVQDLWDTGADTGYELLGEPVKIGWVMIVVVALLSVEWLTRKLLKLA